MRHANFTSLVLIILGIIFLLNNFSYLSWDIWNTTFTYWPVLLIVLGLGLLVSKNGSPQLVMVSAILIFALPFILKGTSLPFNLNFLQQAGGNSTVTLEKKLGTLIGATATFDFKNGDLHIKALEKTAALLVKGELSFNRLSQEPNINFDPKDGVANLVITSSGSNLPVDISGGSWDLSLSPVVPLEITVKSSSGKNNLELASLDIPKLKLDLGKTQTSLQLANKKAQIQITATSGSITISPPSDAAVKLKIAEGTSVDIATRFIKIGEGYQSDGYDNAKEPIEISVNPGSAKLTVN